MLGLAAYFHVKLSLRSKPLQRMLSYKITLLSKLAARPASWPRRAFPPMGLDRDPGQRSEWSAAGAEDYITRENHSGLERSDKSNAWLPTADHFPAEQLTHHAYE